MSFSWDQRFNLVWRNEAHEKFTLTAPRQDALTKARTGMFFAQIHRRYQSGVLY